MGSTPVTTSNSSATGTILAKPNLLQGILVLQDDGGCQLELTRRFKKVCIGKNTQKEIDFVVQTSDGFAYYQVSQTVVNPKTLERELNAFSGLKDAYPRYLLTMDSLGKGRNFDGIKQLNLVQWLLN